MPRTARTRRLLTLTASTALAVGGVSFSFSAFAAPALHPNNINVSAVVAPGQEIPDDRQLRCHGSTEENEYWYGYCAGRTAGIAAGERAGNLCLERGVLGLSPSTDYAWGYRVGWNTSYDRAYDRTYDAEFCANRPKRFKPDVSVAPSIKETPRWMSR